MDISMLFIVVIMIAYIGYAIYLANETEQAKAAVPVHPLSPQPQPAGNSKNALLRWMMYGIVAMMFVPALLILEIAVLGSATEPLPDFDEMGVELPPIDMTAAGLNFGFMLVLSVISIRLTRSQPLRERFQRLVGLAGKYNPLSNVHTLAIILCLFFLSITLDQLVLAGGLTGLAEGLGEIGIPVGEVLFQSVLFVVISFLGVGMAIRRDLPQSLERLGLTIPTVSQIMWGIGVGLALFFAAGLMGAAWQMLASPEQFAEQTAASEQLAAAITTIPMALFISLAAAISEEILFRGALQPIFGLWITSIFFVLVHMQYTLTPATLILLVVALGMGWLRQRYGTTTAIVGHFVYNFVQLVVAILLLSLPTT